MEDQAACKYQSYDPDEQKQDAGSDLVHKTPFRPEDGPSYTGFYLMELLYHKRIR